MPEPFAAMQVLGQIGQGSMATVQLVQNVDARAALKRPLARVAGAQASLLHEAHRLSLVQSPNVVLLLGTWTQDDETALVLEYVHGPSLAALLDASARSQRVLPVGIVIAIMLDMLAGLGALHRCRVDDRAVLHGDVNPRNVLVGIDGRSKLCDLGLSMLEGEQTACFRGTAAYASPESAQGQPLTPASEVFSVGVMLWESLRAARLFRAATEAETLLRVVEAPVMPLDHHRPDLSELAPVVSRALARDPAHRFSAVSELASALGAVSRAATPSELSDFVSALVGPWLARRDAR